MNEVTIKQETFEECFLPTESNEDSGQNSEVEGKDSSYSPKAKKVSRKNNQNIDFSYFVIPREKAQTFVFMKDGKPKFYQNSHKREVDVELTPWQKPVTEELTKHFGYDPKKRSVSYRISMLTDKNKSIHHTYFYCPHKITNKLVFANPEVNAPLEAQVHIKCKDCSPCQSNTNYSASNLPAQSFFSETSNISYEPSVSLASHKSVSSRPRPVTANTMSPNEFMYSISKDFDRFKQSMIDKMETYFASFGHDSTKTKKQSNKRSYVQNSDWEESEDSQDDLPLKKIKTSNC